MLDHKRRAPESGKSLARGRGSLERRRTRIWGAASRHCELAISECGVQQHGYGTPPGSRRGRAHRQVARVGGRRARGSASTSRPACACVQRAGVADNLGCGRSHDLVLAGRSQRLCAVTLRSATRAPTEAPPNTRRARRRPVAPLARGTTVASPGREPGDGMRTIAILAAAAVLSMVVEPREAAPHRLVRVPRATSRARRDRKRRPSTASSRRTRFSAKPRSPSSASRS